MINNIFEIRNSKSFNTPLEYALRSLFLIKYAGNIGIDLDRLIAYDYLLLNTGDIDNAPESIHPAIPFRSAQLLIKREIIQKGLSILLSKGLINIQFTKKGFLYYPNQLTEVFLGYFETEYAELLENRANWVINSFNNYNSKQLERFISKNLDKWGGEFVNESFFRD